MAYGLRCWDSNGNVILDITDRITRIINSFTISKSAKSGDTGTVSDSVFSSTYFLMVKNNVTNTATGFSSSGILLPAMHIVFSTSGNVLTWKVERVTAGATVEKDLIVVYGGY